jgi:hypothetical protein
MCLKNFQNEVRDFGVLLLSIGCTSYAVNYEIDTNVSGILKALS